MESSADQEAAASSSQRTGKGYRRGGVADRGRAVALPLRPQVAFFAIPPVARGWKLVKEEGPPVEYLPQGALQWDFPL